MGKMSLATLAVADAALYGRLEGTHCYAEHGGTPLDAADTPIANVTYDVCESHCNTTPACVGFTRGYDPTVRYSNLGDCYFRSALNVSQCDVGSERSGWDTYQKVDPPPLKGLVLYHLFEPKFTGLADKDAGDFKGDASFIFNTFTSWEKTNPEASMDHNIIEKTEADVVAWGEYEECNAPGAQGMFVCPEDNPTYCCTTFDPNNHSHSIPANHTKNSLPGVEVSFFTLGPAFGLPGFWFSFPAESENVTWTQRLVRRIEGKCMGNAWRAEAGGCAECPGDSLNQCVADCIKAALCVNGSTVQLEAIWDRVFADPNECPDVPLPSPQQPFLDGLPHKVLVV